MLSRFLEGFDKLGCNWVVDQILAGFQCIWLRQSLFDLIQPNHFIHGNDGAIFIYLEDVIRITHAFLLRIRFANPTILKIIAL